MSRLIYLTTVAALALGLFVSQTATAAIVSQIQDSPKDGVFSEAGVFRSLGSGGWVEDDTQVASDGNEVLTVSLDPTDPGYDSSSNGTGYVWYLQPEDFATALGLPSDTKLQDGWVIRQSVWVATSADDPLLTEGDWNDSLKFEYTRSTNPQGGGFSTGNLIPTSFLHNDCDFSTELCSTPPDASELPYPAGQTEHINSENWTQLVMQQEIDFFDFPWALDGILFIRPVLFIGDFESGEDEKGTLYMDRIIVEVFPDLATANATPLDTTNPGGIPGVVTLVEGDYNGNGTVDAADYTVWRDGDSPDSTIAGYNLWVSKFGNTTSTSSSESVPEPTSALLVFGGLAGLGLARRRR